MEMRSGLIMRRDRIWDADLHAELQQSVSQNNCNLKSNSKGMRISRKKIIILIDDNDDGEIMDNSDE